MIDPVALVGRLGRKSDRWRRVMRLVKRKSRDEITSTIESLCQKRPVVKSRGELSSPRRRRGAIRLRVLLFQHVLQENPRQDYWYYAAEPQRVHAR